MLLLILLLSIELAPLAPLSVPMLSAVPNGRALALEVEVEL
jgi:hypothetical protein